MTDQRVVTGEAFSFFMEEDTFTDANGDPLTYTYTTAYAEFTTIFMMSTSPYGYNVCTGIRYLVRESATLLDWLNFDPATGGFSGTPHGYPYEHDRNGSVIDCFDRELFVTVMASFGNGVL